MAQMRMKPLDPAPSERLPVEGWELVATEAGRYAAGLIATIQARNGGPPHACQLPLAHPEKWEAFVSDIAQRSGCPSETITEAIRGLYDAIEVLLRGRRQAPVTDPRSSGDRPRVQANLRYLRDVVAGAVSALATRNEPPTLFRRGGELVRVDAVVTHATVVSVPLLRVLLDDAADFVSTDDEGQTFTPDRPRRDVCESILARPSPQSFPPLASIRTVPVVLPEGRWLTSEGYDPDSGILLRLQGLTNIRDDLSIDEAKRWLCKELLGDFPFVNPSDLAHTVALILEPFLRLMIHDATPQYLIDAPTRGTGKGLLADVVCCIATGRQAPVMTFGQDADEHEKRITSLLLAGHSWILIDNAKALKSMHLAAVLTTTQWRGRRLGKSEIIDVPNDATWVATGNNVELSDEIARRTIPIRLDPGVERPETRTGFKHAPLLDWVKDHRATLVSACLSLIRAWLDAGCPQGTATLGRFDSWAKVLGGVLGVAGVSGFLDDRERLYSESDRQTSEWSAMCEHWWNAYKDHPITAKEVFEVAKVNSLLLSIWGGRSPLAAQQRIGHALADMRDRVFGGYRIRPAGRDSVTKNFSYRIERTASQTPQTLQLPDISAPMQQKNTSENTRKTPVAGVVFRDQTPVDGGVSEKTSVDATTNATEISRGSGVLGVSGVLSLPPAVLQENRNIPMVNAEDDEEASPRTHSQRQDWTFPGRRD